MSLFSELNNLTDITLTPRFATLCGYTDEDIDTVFAPVLEGLDRDAIRDWYDGYRWLGDESVYNPFDILLLFQERRFRPYWFETGSPAFLIETLKEQGVFTLNLEGMVSTEDLLSAFDVNHIGTEALLFQTGYLTIAEELDRGGLVFYRLGYPNRAVRSSLNRSLLQAVGWDEAHSPAAANRLYDALAAADLPGLEAHLRSLFAGIPCNWHVNNPIAHYEGYYASVVYAHFAALGVPVTVEEAGASGRLDLAVRVAGRVYLFEFKVRERSGEGAALAQLQERGYADKHRAGGEPVHLVGVEFSPEARSLTAFETAMA